MQEGDGAGRGLDREEEKAGRQGERQTDSYAGRERDRQTDGNRCRETYREGVRQEGN